MALFSSYTYSMHIYILRACVHENMSSRHASNSVAFTTELLESREDMVTSVFIVCIIVSTFMNMSLTPTNASGSVKNRKNYKTVVMNDARRGCLVHGFNSGSRYLAIWLRMTQCLVVRKSFNSLRSSDAIYLW